MTIKVPEGWKVYVTFANHAASCADGVVVVGAPGGTTPVFGGAATSTSVPGDGVGYFSFTASRQGGYVIASTTPKRARAGEWIRLEVGSGSAAPELVLSGQTYAIVAKAGPGG